MRILFVNQHGGYFGGVEQHIAHIAPALTRRGHTCDLACGPSAGATAEAEFQSLFSQVIERPELAASAERHTDWLTTLCRTRTYDAVYMHKLPWLPEHPGGRTRMVRMVHDHDLTCPRRHKYFAHNGQICEHAAGWRCYLDGAFLARDRDAQLGVRFAPIAPKLEELARHRDLDALLVGSRWMAEQLSVNGVPAARVEIVPPAVPEPHDVAMMVPLAPTLLYAGQLVRGKGVDLLLAALAQVRGPWLLQVVGTGAQEAELRALTATMGLTDRVTFAGWRSPDEIVRAYRQARLVVVPSRWPEPFGMVGLEAMHHGRGVVAFATGGIPDWLDHGHTGLLVAPQDIRGLATAIERGLYERGLAEQFGRAGRIRARERFSFHASVDRIERALQGAVAMPCEAA